MLKAFLKQRASVQANALEEVQQYLTVQHQKTIAKIKQRAGANAFSYYSANTDSNCILSFNGCLNSGPSGGWERFELTPTCGAGN